MEKTSLATLAALYTAEADNLEQMIAACKERRRFALNGGNSREAQRLESLGQLHTQQRAELLRLAAWLRQYYNKAEQTPAEQYGEEGQSWVEAL